MIHRARIRNAGMVLFLAVTLSGCVGSSNGTVATLVTNLPHVVSYVEQFNGQSSKYKISVMYAETPAAFDVNSPPDLVVGPGLGDAEATRKFTDIGDILESAGPERFYDDFVELGVYEEKQLLLPLSFTIPLLIVRVSDTAAFESEMLLDVDELRRLSAEFSSDERIGFLTGADAYTSYLFTRFFDVHFHETIEQVPAWNDALLTETVKYLHDWSVELNGGFEMEGAFIRKYLFDPTYKLVADGRLRFAVSSIDDYLNIPAEIGERLDFRWPSNGEKVYVDEDIVFIGHPKNSRHKKAVAEFLLWLYLDETQHKLLEIDRYRRVRGFGIAGGFSALKSVNSDELTKIHPLLVGHVPGESNLQFPARLPANWPVIREEVISPWLIEQSREEAITQPLSEVLLEWKRLQPSGG